MSSLIQKHTCFTFPKTSALKGKKKVKFPALKKNDKPTNTTDGYEDSEGSYTSNKIESLYELTVGANIGVHEVLKIENTHTNILFDFEPGISTNLFLLSSKTRRFAIRLNTVWKQKLFTLFDSPIKKVGIFLYYLNELLYYF